MEAEASVLCVSGEFSKEANSDFCMGLVFVFNYGCRYYARMLVQRKKLSRGFIVIVDAYC
jgi:hypothetical protein